MPEVSPQPNLENQPTQPQVQQEPKKGTPWNVIIIVGVIALISIGLGIMIFILLQTKSEPASLTTSNNTSEDLPKELLKTQLSEGEINEIENDQLDQKAGSSVREAKTAIEVCVTILQSENKPPESIFTSTDGCADYGFLLSKDYLTEVPSDPKPVLKEDSSSSVICIWAKGGGSSGQNHWVLSATDDAKVVSTDNSAAKVSGEHIKTFDLKSDPKECQKL